MFSCILIANRGEIACRVIATCRRLGIDTVAVFSDADRNARHVRRADEALHIGAAPASESYLDGERIITAARSAGAQAIHPGYGFLAENADFAAACEKARIAFIGPGPQTIRSMGSKRAAKSLMAGAGVPTVPGYLGEDQDPAVLAAEAARIGFPVMIKASAGGGGKGMRIVNTAKEFAAALAGARREAAAAFGDDHIILERYLQHPRHIEFQIFGDAHGTVVHLFDRECSIQRRHQKIIEESPSPFLDHATRQRMAEAALAAARAVDYRNAGTVEFIADRDRSFYFIEMNTRLQVEHPVTELVTGVDLVEWQLRIAAGEPLPLAQDRIASSGHAIEARIYAENPRHDFLPQTGEVARFVHPPAHAALRVDTGIGDGDVVTMHYDPMIAKLIVHGRDRDAAVRAMREALDGTAVFGLPSNVALLRSVAQDPAFASGQIDTGYIEAHLPRLLETGPLPDTVLLAAACRCLLDRQAAAEDTARRDKGEPGSPWHRHDGWQLSGRGGSRLIFAAGPGDALEVRVTGWDGRYCCEIAGRGHPVEAKVLDGHGLRIAVDGEEAEELAVLNWERDYVITLDSQSYELVRAETYPASAALSDEDAHPGSPMPGRIVAIQVAPGERVEQGQALLVLEGMKMEFTLRARTAGVVERVLYSRGDVVDAEVALVDIAPDETEQS